MSSLTAPPAKTSYVVTCTHLGLMPLRKGSLFIFVRGMSALTWRFWNLTRLRPRLWRSPLATMVSVDNAPILIGGFPNHRLGDTATMAAGHVISHRIVSQVHRALVDAPIITGASGGPVVNGHGRVVGVAVTGADSMAKRYATEMHGVIPIQEINNLTFRTEVAPLPDFVERLISEASTGEGSTPTPSTSVDPADPATKPLN